MRSIWIGFDPRESAAFAVAKHSAQRHLSLKIPSYGVVLDHLKRSGLYTRPTEVGKSATGHRQLIDVLSKRDDYNGAVSTEFAISRFLVPHLAKSGWALFMDCDVLVRGSLLELFRQANSKYAVMCVKHDHAPANTVKMDGQVQTRYARKNWSSVVLFNVDHPANKKLTVEMVNTFPGRDLHAFSWLEDDEIGEIGPEWNFLVGHTDQKVKPKIVHFTDGTPDMPGYEDAPFADEWWAELVRWAT